MSEPPAQHGRRIWTKSPFAVLCWIGWAIVGQMFVIGGLFNGYAIGDPTAREYVFKVRGPDAIALSSVWWTSYVSARLAAVGGLLVVLSWLLGKAAERLFFNWYFKTADYRIPLTMWIWILGSVYAAIAFTGVILNILGFTWQFTRPPG